jgi:hypothetical protein
MRGYHRATAQEEHLLASRHQIRYIKACMFLSKARQLIAEATGNTL